MTKLNERSAALANGGNFDLALSDADAIRFIDLACSLGYLKAGSIYQQQGRQREAIAMYEKGLRLVPSSDACYTTLQMRQAEAVNAENKCVDFISRLPLEIAVSVIIPLVFHNHCLEADVPCPYLYVSRIWPQRALQCNSLSFIIFCQYTDPPVQFQELERFGEHVKVLWIEFERTMYDEDPLFILHDYDFPSLPHLTISYYGYEDSDVISALQFIQRTLTHLKLLTGDNYTPEIHLGRVLDVCSNLVSLQLSTSIIHHLTVQYPKLTHLTMETGSDSPFPYDTMMNLLSHMPSLVFLDLYPIPDSRFLTAIWTLPQHEDPALQRKYTFCPRQLSSSS
ncbi:predicted protein [Lichtheimia corymbifera JMRC:FSU:9682]|uniref:Uncharacterized protein n=1 Tax=Lichtheimia corymbifera JMRC:FSU:9682 TaxID=1263082 RepID=A0A068SI45_9FUNG|nr:predicted protein [Lichtheimia corymbifera JMRC:FSU:9682]